MAIPSLDESLPPEEVERRMDYAVRRALNTPPQPRAKPTPNPQKGKDAAPANAGKRG